MATWRSTTFTELVEPSSPDEGFAIDNARAQRVIKVAYADREQAVTDFLGTATIQGGGSSRWVSRTIPHSYPGTAALYATSAPRVVGIGPRGATGSDETHLATYQAAAITLVYTAPAYDYRSDDDMATDALNDLDLISEGVALKVGNPRYIVRESRPASRLLVLNKGLMQTIDTPPATVPEGVPISIPAMDVLYTWMHVPYTGIPRNAHMAAIGCINDDTFDGFPAQTLLCETPDIKPVVDPFGNRTWNVQYRFKFLPNNDPTTTPATPRGWRWLLKPVLEAGARRLRYREVSSDGTSAGTRLYETFDFTRLFEPDR